MHTLMSSTMTKRPRRWMLLQSVVTVPQYSRMNSKQTFNFIVWDKCNYCIGCLTSIIPRHMTKVDLVNQVEFSLQSQKYNTNFLDLQQNIYLFKAEECNMDNYFFKKLTI